MGTDTAVGDWLRAHRKALGWLALLLGLAAVVLAGSRASYFAIEAETAYTFNPYTGEEYPPGWCGSFTEFKTDAACRAQDAINMANGQAKVDFWNSVGAMGWLLFVLGLLLIAGPWAYRVVSRLARPERCTYCRGRVPPEATVCRHCGREIERNVPLMADPPPQPAALPPHVEYPSSESVVAEAPYLPTRRTPQDEDHGQAPESRDVEPSKGTYRKRRLGRSSRRTSIIAVVSVGVVVGGAAIAVRMVQDRRGDVVVVTQSKPAERCDKRGAHVDLSKCDLRGKSMVGAYLANANLAGAQLQGADLSHSDLSGSNLAGAQLTNAVIDGADLSSANLTNADLTRASLVKAKLNSATLTDANFLAATLSGVSLENAVCAATDFRSTVVDGIDVVGVDLSTTKMDGGWRNITADAATKWPPGISLR